MASPDCVLTILEILSSAFPNFKLRPETAEIYTAALSDLSRDVLMRAVGRCLHECKFFPSIAEIRERAYGDQDIPSSAEAWEEVMQQVYQVGHLGQPTFRNPLVEQIVAAIGWREICLSENVIADRAHFFRLYEELASRAKADQITLNILAFPNTRRNRHELSAP